MRSSHDSGDLDWLLLLNAMTGSFLAGLDARIFMISLPTVARALGTDIVGISLAVISFQLAATSLPIVFGRLGDLYGRYITYGIGFLVMTIASFLCGISVTVFQLGAFRFLQGVGAAMVQSTGRALAMEAARKESQGKVQGLMTAAYHSGLFIGPPISGFLIDYVGWRWIFFLLVPIGVIGLGVTWLRFARRGPSVARGHRPPVDYAGAGLFIISIITLTLLLYRPAVTLPGMTRADLLASAFVITFGAFLLNEVMAPDPMIKFTLFRIRMFVFSSVSLLIIATIHSLVTFLIPFYLQGVLHLSPSSIGVIFLAPPVFTLSLATLSGHIADRVGPRIPTTFGILMMLSALLIGMNLKADSSWLLPAVMLGFVGLGAAFFNAPNATAILASVPREDRGFTTGVINTMFGLGELLGISLGGALLTLMFQYYSGVRAAAPTPDQPAAFVPAMNTIYTGCLVLGLVAFAASLMRGSAKTEEVQRG